MTQQTKSRLLLLLSLAPWITAAISMSFLPDQIPLHYNFAGEIDRWGSKYEEFFLAGVFSLAGFILWFMGKWNGKCADTEEESVKAKANAKTVVTTGIVVQLFMCVLQVGFLWSAMREIESEATTMSLPMMQVTVIGLGILFIIMGIIMPKTRPNSMIGIRTRSSRKSPELWRKTQVFGGVVFVAAGAITVVGGLFFEGPEGIIVLMAATLGAAILSTIYPWYLTKKKK